MIITILVRCDSASAKYLWTSMPETQTCISMSVVFTYHFKKVIETSQPFIGESLWPIGRTGALRKTHTVELFFQIYSGGLSFLHEELHNHCVDCYSQILDYLQS